MAKPKVAAVHFTYALDHGFRVRRVGHDDSEFLTYAEAENEFGREGMLRLLEIASHGTNCGCWIQVAGPPYRILSCLQSK